MTRESLSSFFLDDAEFDSGLAVGLDGFGDVEAGHECSSEGDAGGDVFGQSDLGDGKLTELVRVLSGVFVGLVHGLLEGCHDLRVVFSEIGRGDVVAQRRVGEGLNEVRQNGTVAVVQRDGRKGSTIQMASTSPRSRASGHVGVVHRNVLDA